MFVRRLKALKFLHLSRVLRLLLLSVLLLLGILLLLLPGILNPWVPSDLL